MVLKRLKNNSDKDRTMPWGSWNITIKAGGFYDNPSQELIRAFTSRYPEISFEIVEPVKEIVEPVKEPLLLSAPKEEPKVEEPKRKSKKIIPEL